MSTDDGHDRPAHGGLQPYGGPPAVPAPVHGYGHLAPPPGYGPGLTLFPQPYKDTSAAWLLWFFLGHWGAHDFYLRRPVSAVVKLLLTLVGLATVWIVVGVLPLFAVFVWWVVDAFTMSGRLQQVNARVHAHNRAIGAAHESMAWPMRRTE